MDDQVAALTKGTDGESVYWAERLVTTQYKAKYEAGWLCTFLRVFRDDSAIPPYDEDDAWLNVAYVGRLLGGVPVVRIGNIAKKAASRVTSDELYLSFDKEWYNYVNRHPVRVLDTGIADTLTLYSCVSVFKTQFESVILYSETRTTDVPDAATFSAQLNADFGIVLAPINLLLPVPQDTCDPLPVDGTSLFEEVEDEVPPPPEA